jgi:hypothetical protein
LQLNKIKFYHCCSDLVTFILNLTWNQNQTSFKFAVNPKCFELQREIRLKKLLAFFLKCKWQGPFVILDTAYKLVTQNLAKICSVISCVKQPGNTCLRMSFSMKKDWKCYIKLKKHWICFCQKHHHVSASSHSLIYLHNSYLFKKTLKMNRETKLQS